MTSRFDGFTESARQVLTLAQTEAIGFDHNYIGAGHILLGLAEQDECVAAKVLSELGVAPAAVRTAIEFVVGRSDATELRDDLGLTPRAERALQIAADEAGQDGVGTEHLLLGLVREGSNIAAGVLAELGVDIDGVCEASAIQRN